MSNSDTFTESHVTTLAGGVVAITVTYDQETGEIVSTDNEKVGE